jgi:hypothetical protein
VFFSGKARRMVDRLLLRMSYEPCIFLISWSSDGKDHGWVPWHCILFCILYYLRQDNEELSADPLLPLSANRIAMSTAPSLADMIPLTSVSYHISSQHMGLVSHQPISWHQLPRGGAALFLNIQASLNLMRKSKCRQCNNHELYALSSCCPSGCRRRTDFTGRPFSSSLPVRR